MVLRSYGVSAADEVHALRMLRSALHGFATLESGGGFQLGTDVDESFAWLVEFVDGGCADRDAPRALQRVDGVGPVPAVDCDLDHVVPFPQGPTTAENLRAFCRSHHRFKTQYVVQELRRRQVRDPAPDDPPPFWEKNSGRAAGTAVR